MCIICDGMVFYETNNVKYNKYKMFVTHLKIKIHVKNLCAVLDDIFKFDNRSNYTIEIDNKTEAHTRWRKQLAVFNVTLPPYGKQIIVQLSFVIRVFFNRSKGNTLYLIIHTFDRYYTNTICNLF